MRADYGGVDQSGKVYGMLTVISESDRTSANRRVLVKCSCGSTEKTVQLATLKSGSTVSCGCFGKDQRKKATVTHGLSNHPLYVAWGNLKARCYRAGHPEYKNYGARGISVCAEWLESPKEFITFCIGKGWEKGLEIDRVDNDGNYEPGNIRFVNKTMNLQNTRTITSRNTSGFRGVAKCRDKFVAVVQAKGYPHLSKGGFSTAIEAALVRDKFCIDHEIPVQLNDVIGKVEQGYLLHEENL